MERDEFLRSNLTLLIFMEYGRIQKERKEDLRCEEKTYRYPSANIEQLRIIHNNVELISSTSIGALRPLSFKGNIIFHYCEQGDKKGGWLGLSLQEFCPIECSYLSLVCCIPKLLLIIADSIGLMPFSMEQGKKIVLRDALGIWKTSFRASIQDRY